MSSFTPFALSNSYLNLAICTTRDLDTGMKTRRPERCISLRHPPPHSPYHIMSHHITHYSTTALQTDSIKTVQAHTVQRRTNRTERHELFRHIGFDWKPESTATEVDEALRGDTESLRGEYFSGLFSSLEVILL